MLKSVTTRDYMTSSAITLKPAQDVLEAAETLLEYRLSGAPVVNEHAEVIGFLSEKDCLHTVLSAIYNGDLGDTVSDRMSKEVISVHPEDSIADVAEKFLKSTCRTFPVIEKNVLVGMISRNNILQALEKIGVNWE
ncbi:CBS domain-containing protein [Pleionea sp. CnH1-48]|uniref:CBS domain-containing protein n=1 Tax=Pleionea sp. CnH1-48 TaxID=2954494 RepID=UPI00209796C8|nr:CBS domain-containing protein [Pleionea sp. CnH1-48]MCO7225082.1 CBS domain-containing protein [Pleionea sp. CnH1-48]